MTKMTPPPLAPLGSAVGLRLVVIPRSSFAGKTMGRAVFVTIGPTAAASLIGAARTEVLPGGGPPASKGAVGTVHCCVLTSPPMRGGRGGNGAPVTWLDGIVTDPRGAEPAEPGGIRRLPVRSK